MADTLSSINVDKLTSSVNDAVSGGTFEISQAETIDGSQAPQDSVMGGTQGSVLGDTQPIQTSVIPSLQPTTPVLHKGIYSVSPTLTPKLATMKQLYQLTRALSMATQPSAHPGTSSESVTAGFLPRTHYLSLPPAPDSVTQGLSVSHGLSGVHPQSCVLKQQESYTERNTAMSSNFQSKLPDLCQVSNQLVSESSTAMNLNESLSSPISVANFGISKSVNSFPLTYFHAVSQASEGTVSYSLPSTMFGQSESSLTTTTVTATPSHTATSSATLGQDVTQSASTAPLCISPVSPASSPVMSTQSNMNNLNISSLPFMLSWQVSDKHTESSDKSSVRTVSPADPNRLTPFTNHFPISLPVLSASDRQLIQQLPLSGEELPTPTGSSQAFTAENLTPSQSHQLMVDATRQENLPDSHQSAASQSDLYAHSANEMHAAASLNQSEVNKSSIGMALSLLSQSAHENQSSNCQPNVTMAMSLLSQSAHENQSSNCQPNVTMAMSLLSQSAHENQSSNCQPSVTMAMSLLAEAAHSESQSQVIDCQPNVTLAMNLLNQVSNSDGHVIPQADCDAEHTSAASLASLSSSLTGQDGFPSVPANMAHLFHFSQASTSQSQQIMPTITFSPEADGQNIPARVFMSSPITMVPISHDQQDKNHHDNMTSPSPAALALANMSVIDMLLKNHSTELHAAEKSADISTNMNKSPAITGHYCVECNNTYKEPCKFHITDYFHLTDTPILSRARASLPLTFHLQKSSLNGHFSDVGVFCNETVKLRTLLGPLVGKPVPSEMWESSKKFALWKIFFEDCFSVLDISDEHESNWLMFVKPARNALEQNLVAFQKNEDVYFVTCKDVEPGQELLFWYAKDYAKLLGLSPKPRRNGTSYCPYCCICEKVFPDRKSLKLHKKEEHPNLTERKWSCQFCHRRFTSSAKLNTHVIALHLHFKPFYCLHCGKQFADQSNLRHHMNIHTGEKKFVCELCQKSFRQKSHLVAHKLVHTGIKALQCQYCSVKFGRRSDLKQHEYQHTKEKVYPCSECMKVFYKLQNYNKHVKIHNNERNYHCQHCPKTFVTSYHLKRHLKACKGLKNAVMKMSSDADDALFDEFNDNVVDDEGIARIIDIADVAPTEGTDVFDSGTRRSSRGLTRFEKSINMEEA